MSTPFPRLLGAAAVRVIVAVIALACAAPHAVSPSVAADIRVFTSGAPAAVQQRLAPAFAKASGHNVVLTAETLNEIRKRMDGGATPDVVVLARAALLPFQKSGALRPGTLVDLARTGIGVVVKAGAPLPDISTVDALKK